MKTKKKLKIKWKNLFLLLFILLCLIVAIISSVNILKNANENKNTKEEIKKIESISEVNEIEDTENTEVFIEEDLYWKYRDTKLIDVNFDDLKTINSNTVGWIQINNTNVNYPVVQTTDNDYYLTHSFENNYSSAGWVFMDYRNNPNDYDKNTIIYAHGRYDKTMFGSLVNTMDEAWYQNEDNHIIKFATEDTSSLWQIFSIYTIPDTNDYLKVEFNNNYRRFLNKIKKRSTIEFNTDVNENDKILTLSTCYNKTSKLVIHAKLIKLSTK